MRAPASGLDSLQLAQEFQEDHSKFFPTIDSWRWYKRQHGDELVKVGAIITITGRDYVNPTVLEKMILKIGRRAAAERCGN